MSIRQHEQEPVMTTRKTLVATIGALALGATLVASASPAQAKYGQNAAFFGGLAAGVAGTLAFGALSARPAYAAPTYYYGGSCYFERRAVTNYWGDVVGFRRVRVCN
jgi:hypothetical protein